MDEKTWWDFWNTSYRAKDNNDGISSELFGHVVATINEITQPGRGRVLEIACGSGSLSRLLNYSSYHGLDLSAAAIEIARQQSEHIQPPPGAGLPTYEAADFHDWAPPQTFDVVVCVDAIAYFRDQRLVLKKMAECLRTSGRLVLTTINPFVYQRIKRTRDAPLDEGPVSHWLPRAVLHALVESAGLRIERSHTIMPRGHLGILRLVNSWRVDKAVGPSVAGILRHCRERAGFGQYRFVVARKDA
jgi:2-polyprenyl-3-methyl-5-hydroxy-6-metoxy-1,4-benzoquinol methylase